MPWLLYAAAMLIMVAVIFEAGVGAAGVDEEGIEAGDHLAVYSQRPGAE